MHDDQLDTFQMLTATRALLAAAPETQTDPGLARVFAELVAFVTQIDDFATEQQKPITGVTKARDQTLEDATVAAEAVAGRLFAYASEHGLEDLAVRARFSRRTFGKVRLPRRPTVLQEIHDIAASVLPALADYGVTSDTLAELQAKVTAALDSIVSPRGAIVGRRATTQHLAALLAGAMTLVRNRLDPVMLTVRRQNPDFYFKYRMTRHVIAHRGRRRRDATAVATDAPAAPAGELASLAA